MRVQQPKVRVTSDRMHQLFNRIDRKVAKRTDELAQAGFEMLRAEMEKGLKNGGTREVWGASDLRTGASRESIYRVLSNGNSNYDDQKSSFQRLVKGGRTTDELTFPEFIPTALPGQHVASFASMSLIVGFWEYGHHNIFTKRYESVPIVSWVAFVLFQRMKLHYAKILD